MRLNINLTEFDGTDFDQTEIDQKMDARQNLKYHTLIKTDFDENKNN